MTTYVVTATADVAPGIRRALMHVEVVARTNTEALMSARKRAYEYFDRHDYVRGTLTYNATRAD